MAESDLKIGRMFKKAFKAVGAIALPVAGASLGFGGLFGGGGNGGGPTGTTVHVQAQPPQHAGLFGLSQPVTLLILFTVIGVIALAFFGRRS